MAASADRLDKLLTRLFVNPDVANIRPHADPRFRWLHDQTRHRAPNATTLQEVVQTLRDRHDDALGELVAHLIEYTQSLAASMLEEELFDIVAPLLPHAADRVPILLARLGWDGGPVRTLAEAGEAAGVTRERIRQMQLRLETKLAEQSIWTPMLDRALGVIGRRVPLPANQVGQVLLSAGLSGVATFDAEGLIQAQQLFRHARGLEIQEIEGIRLVVDERSPACADLAGRLATIRTVIMKQVSHQGLTSIPEIASELHAAGQQVADHEIRAMLVAIDRFQTVDGHWVIPAEPETRNPLVNRINKLLVLRAGIPVPFAVAQLERDEERGYAVSDAGLRVFCHHRPDLSLANDRIYPAEPLDPSIVLSDGERAIVDAFRRHEAATLSFSTLVEAIQGAGLATVTASMLARRSVILRKLDRDCYALIDSFLDERDAGEPPSSTTLENAPAAIPSSARTPTTGMDLAAVAIEMVRRLGAVTIADVLGELEQRGRHIGQGELLPYLVLAPDLAILDGRWIVGSRLMRPYPVIERAEKLLAVFPGIPLRRAVSQVTRGAEIVSLPRKQAIAQMLQSRDEFVIEHERLFPRQPVEPERVLETVEQFLLSTLRPHPDGLPRDALSDLAAQQQIPAEDLDDALATSPIVFSPRAGVSILCAAAMQEALPVTSATERPPTTTDGASATAAHVHPKWLQGMMTDLDRARPTIQPAPANGDGQISSAPAPDTSDQDGTPPEESAAVRATIMRSYEVLTASTGIVTLDELRREVNKAGVRVTRSRVAAAISRIEPLAVLQDSWVASLGTRLQNVLTARLQTLLAVCPRLSVSQARTQLLRSCPAYKDFPGEAIAAFAAAHPGFLLDDGMISSRVQLLPRTELGRDAHTIYQVLALARSHMSATELAHATRGRQRLTEERVRAVLRQSVIVTEDARGRYALVRPEEATVIPSANRSLTDEEESAEDSTVDSSSLPLAASQHPVVPAQRDTLLEETHRRSPAATPDSLRNSSQDEQTITFDASPVELVDNQRCGTTNETSATIEELVRKVRDQSILLPEIQRDYVWKRTQVRDLLDSLYRNFPIGAMLMWNTSELPVARALGGHERIATGTSERQFLLDGQQRLTSLSHAMFGGDPDIRFNLATEEFRVANATTRSDKRWIKVADVFTRGSLTVLKDAGWLDHEHAELFQERIERLRNIRNRRVIINELTDFSYEDVTEIFIRVNSRGTRLKTAELAVAQLAFRLPGMVTDNLRGYEEELAERGWEIDSRFLLRCLTAVATNQVTYAGLNTVDEEQLRDGWERARQAMDAFLFLIEDLLGIASIDWLSSTSSFIIPVVYLTRTQPGDRNETALLRWFLLANVRSRYSGATETAMAQDLRILTDHPDDPFPKLYERIGGMVNGRMAVTERDLDGARQGSPLFLLSFLAMRKAGARDWWTGERLARTNLDSGQLLAVHQIFPKSVFGRVYDQQKVNEIANLAFLARPPSRDVAQAKNLAYLATIPPERLEQQCVPLQTGDWQATRFDAFLRDRRKKLVVAINEILNSPL